MLVKLDMHSLIALESASFPRTDMLEQMNYDADLCFLGDSITQGNNFKSYFQEYKIVNLGISSETLQGMLNRVDEVAAVKPEKVFILGGINSLSKYNMNSSLSVYRQIIADLKQSLPNCKIFIQSVLPISEDKEDVFRDNQTIRDYNSILKELAFEYQIPFIDLYSRFEEDGYMNERLAKDGVHPNEEGNRLWCDVLNSYIRGQIVE